MSRTYLRANPVCIHCDREIYGGGETKYTDGWIHAISNSERCDRRRLPKAGNLAEPRTLGASA